MLTNLCIKFSINFTYSRNLLQNNVLFIAGHYSCSKFGKFIQIQDYHLGNRITLIQSLVKDSTIIVIIYKAIFLYFCPFTNWKFGKSIQNFDCFRVIGNSFSAVYHSKTSSTYHHAWKWRKNGLHVKTKKDKQKYLFHLATFCICGPTTGHLVLPLLFFHKWQTNI